MAKFNPPARASKPDDEHANRVNLSTLPLSEIFPDPENDHIYEVNEEQDQALMNSIREHGILQPLLLRPHPSLPNKFMLVAGHRRYRAAKALGLDSVPVMTLKAKGEVRETIRSQIQFIETNAMARAMTVQEKMAMILALEKSYQNLRVEDESIKGIPTRQLIAQSMGMSERQIADYMTVRNGLSYRDWDDWNNGKLSLSDALTRVKLNEEGADEPGHNETDAGIEKGKQKNEGVLILRNHEARVAFLDTWVAWTVLCRVPKLNLVVREFILPDESKILSYDFGDIAGNREEHKQIIKKGCYVSFDKSTFEQLIAHLEAVVPSNGG